MFYLSLVISRTYLFMFDRFHAKEYPAYDKEVFPYNMGYCQVGKDALITSLFLQFSKSVLVL